MKASEFREMSKDDLGKKVDELKNDLLKFRFESAAGQVKNPLKKRILRKDIARILTVIKEK